MAFIQRFTIEGLAGKAEPCFAELTPYVNVCFGLNGSGKTSLLRILHSALKGDAEILKDVPFRRAEVVVYSYNLQTEITYTITKRSTEATADMPPEAEYERLALLHDLAADLAWKGDPELRKFPHKYLPISRLYAAAGTRSSGFLASRAAAEREEALELRFATQINSLWKDYSTGVTRDINKAQEAGLAKILEDVIAPSTSGAEKSSADVTALLRSVSNFLVRRGMQGIAMTPQQFEQRYNSDPQLKGVVDDIDNVERVIAGLTKPQETFKALVNELFRGTKRLTLKDKELEIDASDQHIDLSTLSSGEKQLIRIFVDLLAVGGSIILVDEPEMSMHVDWQRKLVRSMRTLNPVAQIILATHSPEIMADLEDDEIFKL
jgi:predicted ATPase